MSQLQQRTPAASSKSPSPPRAGGQLLTREVPRPTRLENQVLPPRRPTCEEIAQRAFELYEARGCVDGHDREDWARAERELTLGRL